MKNIFKKAAEGIKNAGEKTVEFVKDNRYQIATAATAIVGMATLVTVSMITNKKVYKQGVHDGIMGVTNAFDKIGVTDGYIIQEQHTTDGCIYRVTHGHSADSKIIPMGRMFNSIVGCCMEHDEADDTNFDIENYLDSGVNVSADLSDKVVRKDGYVEFKPEE